VKEGNGFEGWKKEILEEENRRATGREQYRDRSPRQEIQVFCELWGEKEEERVWEFCDGG